ncbi:calcineurin-like phosphoesterase family protein [Rhizobium leguminosarum]|uniref:metallophosphoesterase n=1 Tax=Rhizobium leguminosarum TaxID=384 RepID=UPI0016112286|nr:calcineurin-like phosphoesterase family protein [Rhizobium leguminosarum]
MTARNVWFISDTHFGHNNIITYCRPQFSSLSEMEEAIIDNWNAAVKPQDLVYHLGDFAWKTEDAKRVRPKLNGAIRLIVGNHDDIPSLAAAGIFQRIALWRQFRDEGFTASHIPMRLDQLRHGTKNLHGHVHGNLEGLEGFHRDMSVESIGFTPVHFDDVALWAKS